MHQPHPVLTPAAERDRAFHLHAYTRLRQLGKDSPLVILRTLAWVRAGT